MEFLLRSGKTITMTVEELNSMLYVVAKKAAQIVRGETVSRAEAIRILGSRSVVDNMVARDIIHPITAGGNCKWKVLVSELMYAHELHEREQALKRKKTKIENI